MATIQWLGVSGEWSTPAEWNADAVPGPWDDAVIAAPGNYTLTVTTPASIGSVLLKDPGAILDIQPSGTLVVSGSLDVQSGTLDIGQFGALAISGTLLVQSVGTLTLGGTIDGGSLIIARDGTLVTIPHTPGLLFANNSPTLQDITVLGGLKLNGASAVVLSGNTSIKNAPGTGPGAITLNGDSLLGLAENYTFNKLTLNGGDVVGANGSATVAEGGLVQGYGSFIYGPFLSLSLDNEGTINSNVAGQWLNLIEMPVVNDGLILASGGGNMSINYGDPFGDTATNGTDGVISVRNGGTLQIGGSFTNDGLIKSVNSTVYFGDNLFGTQNAGDIRISGGTLILGNQSFSGTKWTDSGRIATADAAVNVQGSGIIAAGGALKVLGGSVSGPASIEDAGRINLGGASAALSSLTIDAGGALSGWGSITNPIENSGTIDASHGKLDIAGPITGSGQFQIGKLAILELGSTTAEAITIEGKHGTLFLDTASNFSGVVAGLVNSDAIDLADFAFSSHPVITGVAGTGVAGSTTDVTVSDGTLSTTLRLLNQSAGQFPVASSAYALTSDHNGSSTAGTLFTLASG